MVEEDRITQDIEMMINKRNRCEDWVASVASRKQTKKNEGKKITYDFNIDDDFSDVSYISGAKRRVRKTVNPRKLLLTFICEWKSCKYSIENKRSEFSQHVSRHVESVAIIKKTDDAECYLCLWESCNFQSISSSEIKRHVNYHAYHTILKAAALELHNLWNFERCKLDNENKNWLPDLSNPFECNYGECSYLTDNFQAFLDHVNAHVSETTFDNSKKKDVPCSWKSCCSFKCRSKIRMKIHLKRHTGEKTVACPTCGALFATNTKYMDHCIRKIPAKIECNRCQYCLRYFSSERLLRDHMRYHINSYKCSFCEMTCSTPATLANHVRYRHLNEKPFKCSECPFTSKSAEDCNVHMTTHDAENRFFCEADGCEFSCRTMVTFKKHFKTVHLMERGPIYCCHLCDKKYNRGPCLGDHLRKKHKLEHPPGHTRFRYMENIDGFFRLQVERYESLELNNVKVSVTKINEQMQNYVLKENTTENDKCKKFTVCVEQPEENPSTSGTLIAIDEIDEEGNLIKTSTVREEIIEPSNQEILFVDVNEQNVQVDNENCDKGPQNCLESNGLSTINTNLTNKPTRIVSVGKDYYCNFVFVDVNEPQSRDVDEPNIREKPITADVLSTNKNMQIIKKRNDNKVHLIISKKNKKNFSDYNPSNDIIIKED